VARADGAWRMYAFADAAALTDPESRLVALCEFLAASASSPLLRFAPPRTQAETLLDLRAILQQPHREVDVAALPAVLRLPAAGCG
jgi:phenol 2-monooxygenase (NADPH)